MRGVQARPGPGGSLCSCAPALCPHSLAALRTHSARLTQGQKAAFARRLLQVPSLGAVPTWPLAFLRAVLPLLPHLPLPCFLQLTPQQVGCEPRAPAQAARHGQRAHTPQQAGVPTLPPCAPERGLPPCPTLHPWSCTPWLRPLHPSLALHAEPTALAGSPSSSQEARAESPLFPAQIWGLGDGWQPLQLGLVQGRHIAGSLASRSHAAGTEPGRR